MQVAIERRRVEGKHVVQTAVYSTDPEEKQKVLELLSEHFDVQKLKKGLHVIGGTDSVVPVKKLIEDHFSDARFISITQLEMLGGLES